MELADNQQSMSLEEGALVCRMENLPLYRHFGLIECKIEPLAVAVMAVASVADMQHNANVAVFGAGPVGLL